MLDNLKRWYELLSSEGINSKKIVKDEIAEVIKLYDKNAS